MILGIGHDIVDNNRIENLLQNYKSKFINKILSNLEQNELLKYNTFNRQVRYIAKRFAAKEAFAKACGTGIRSPILMTHISILNDSLGKPDFVFAPALNEWLKTHNITNALVSLTDEKNISSAFVILQ